MSAQKVELPPGVTIAELNSFFTRAGEIVGQDNVSKDYTTGAPEGMRGEHTYGDPFPLDKPHIPGGAIRPSTVDQVRQIVRLANEFKVPLWTISRGKNLGYGGSAPVVSGSIVLDLHHMDKIVEINEEHAYAIVEPGVTFMDLYDAIQERGLNLWLSVPALGWGSVLGNTLERGIGYTPEAVHYKNQSGLEVVLPNGDLVRTGMGAVENSKVFALYPGGYGPGLDGLFFQSNYGIVTKMGIHLSPAPESYVSISVDVPKVSDVIPLVDIITDLMRRKVVVNAPQLFDKITLLTGGDNPAILSALGPYAALDKHIPDDFVDKLCADHGIPSWRITFALYGLQETTAGLLAAVKRKFDDIPGAVLTTQTSTAAPGEYLKSSEVFKDFLPQNGVPSIEALKPFIATKDGLWHNCFSPVLPPSGRDLYDWYLTAREITAANDLNFIADFHVFDRYIIAIDLVIFHPSARGRLRNLQYQLMEDGQKRGILEYRAHVSFMDRTAEHQNFNNGAFARLATLLKDSIDPNGVLSPGKSGIWNSTKKARL